MPATFTVPDDYHYVVAALSLPALVAWGQTTLVARYRRRINLPYPHIYADKAQAETNPEAHIFNCIQRAHQNTVENLPLMVLSTAITGLRYPFFAAGVCTFWAVCRIPYTLGYVSGDPEKRLSWGGREGFLSNFFLSFVAAFVAGKRLLEAKY